MKAPVLASARIGPAQRIRLGHGDIDRTLGGGIARGRVHELFAATGLDLHSAAGFAAALAARAGGRVAWLREERAERRGGRLHPPGLAEIGIDPARLILCVTPDAPALLRAGVDVLRCAGIGVAVIELWGGQRLMTLTASRRLALAAEGSGVTGVLVRIEAEPVPSLAQTRWRVASAPSRPLEANAPGSPMWTLDLLRQRGGAAGGRWRVEWDRDKGIVGDGQPASHHEAPLPGAVVPLSAGGPGRAGDAHLLRTG